MKYKKPLLKLLTVIFTIFIAAQNASAQPGKSKNRLLVRFKDDTPNSEKAELRLAVQGILRPGIPEIGTEVWEVPEGISEQALDRLTQTPAVEVAEPDFLVEAYQITPNDPWWPNQWSAVNTKLPETWVSSTGSSQVVVAVLDTGVDFTQPDLQGAFVSGTDIVNSDNDPTDDHGHGTYAAGIVGARGNNGIGVAGTCWSCALMPVKVLGSSGSGVVSHIAQGMIWAADHGAKVINMSSGLSSDSSTLKSAVDYARNKGIVLVAAAGNAGTTSMNYPAAYSNVIGVAGSDSTNNRYSWSNYGSWVKVAAPGGNMTTGRNAWYGNFSGTSSASPLVAGIAGLLISALPSATASQIEEALTRSALSVNYVQYGKVDAYAALAYLNGGSTGGGGGSTEPPPPTPTDAEAPVVAVTSPTSGTVVPSGNVSVKIQSSDNVGVVKVELWIDGVLKNTSNSSNPTFTWNTKRVSKGPHTLQGKAYDAAGNVGQSAVIQVTR